MQVGPNYKIMVTVQCLVFNQKPYLRQCLDGIVRQKTNFSFEAIVHDDASTDGSAAIIKEYADKFPNIIKPILQKNNQYSIDPNLILKILNENSIGKYIAICEGDDYWTDSYKLQKQVDFLETHPDVAMCTHAYDVVTGEGKILGPTNVLPNDGYLDVGKVIENFQAPQTATFLYRNRGEMPAFFKKLDVGDYPIRVYNAISGGVYYMNTVMSCYRRYSSGSWTSQMTGDKEKFLSHVGKMIEFANELDKYTDNKYHDSILRRIDYCQFLIYVRNKEYFKAFNTCYFKNKHNKEKLIVAIQYAAPKLWYFLQKLNKHKL